MAHVLRKASKQALEDLDRKEFHNYLRDGLKLADAVGGQVANIKLCAVWTPSRLRK